MRQDGEASVEEILESIKKVIARDNREDASRVQRRRERAGLDNAPEPATTPDETEEVLELDQPAFLGRDNDDHDDDRRDDEAEESLLTEKARKAMEDNLAALAMVSEPGAQPQIVRSGETSLEGLVREMLRPMLAEWLDANLPGMVETMVKAEISRIAGKRG